MFLNTGNFYYRLWSCMVKKLFREEKYTQLSVYKIEAVSSVVMHLLAKNTLFYF